jgi:hypothetical protein
MTSAISIVGVRRTRLASVVAFCLILLTALPFTAPFSVCDEAELTAESAGLDKQPGSKVADDSVDLSALTAVSLDPSMLVSLLPVETALPSLERSRFLIVLRI